MRTYNTIIQIICMSVIIIQLIQCSSVDDPITKHLSADFYKDTSQLYKALEDTEDLEESIIEVVVRRSNTERQLIRKLFEILYNKDLLEEIQHRIYHNFRKVILALMTSSHDFYAQELYTATLGLGTDEQAISDILISMNNSEILQVCFTYQNVIGNSLRYDLADDLSGSFLDLILALLDAKRNEDESVNFNAVVKDVKELGDSTVNQSGNQRDKLFIRILTTRSYPHLRAMFEEFKNVNHIDIMDTIKTYFFHDIQYGLLTIAKHVIYSTSEFYAMLLKESMSGLGTNDFSLIRIIVGRSEIDLKDIQECYEKMYMTSLTNDITADTSGLYLDTLLAILKKSNEISSES